MTETRPNYEALAQTVSEFYETHGKDFAATRQGVWGVMRLVLEAARDAETLIDVGAGNARLASILPQGLHYIAIEPSSSLREASRQMVIERPGAELRKGGFPCLPVADDEADVVACLAVLHHIVSASERRRAIKELARITRSGGRVIVTAWNLRSRKLFRVNTWLAAWFRLPLVRGGGFGDVWIPWKANGVIAKRYVHAFTLHELRSLFDQRDWMIERAEAWGNDGPESMLSAKNLVVVAKRKAPAA